MAASRHRCNHVACCKPYHTVLDLKDAYEHVRIALEDS